MVDPLKIFWVLTNSTYLVTKLMREGDAVLQQDPYFAQPLLEAEVDEDALPMQHVITVAAGDSPDFHKEHGVRFEIAEGNEDGSFTIDGETGDVSVTGPLDYETRTRYELRLAAIGAEGELLADATLLVRVRDANDMAPVFERSVYRAQLTEEDDHDLPKKILTIKAVDGDQDRPQNVVYFITGPGIDPDSLETSNFRIDGNTGDIFVLKALDRDPPHGRPQWRFTVFAQDEGGEGLVGYADVQVSLKDVNDNAPHFQQPIYWGNITENGSAGIIVLNMSAIDYDDVNEGTNAKILYSIEKNVIEEESGTSIFEIDKDTGEIKTSICCLDRERTPDYSIQVVATDGGGLKGTGTASIFVIDINDMPPEFSKDEWLTEIDETDGENIPDKPILTVTVHDQDELNDFQYKIVDNSGYGADKFTLTKNNDGTGSLRVIKPLDFEDPHSNVFRFRIQVTDKNENRENVKFHTAYSWVTVKLRDINDNKPQFSKNNKHVFIKENAAVGKSVERFQAKDPDRGGKSAVRFFIERNSDPERQFSISKDGIIYIQRSLDREKQASYEIHILAVDDGLPPKTSTATLIVTVEDINDNEPTLLKHYHPIVPENSPARQIIEIFAKDEDDYSKNNGPPFTFMLDPSSESVIKTSFKIQNDPNGDKGRGSAFLYSLKTFDREHSKKHFVPVVITDSGNPPLARTSTVTVIIGDINDNKMQPSSKHIVVYNYVGQSEETDIGRIYVHDPDDWDLHDKKFIWANAEHQKFKLEENTGLLTMLRGTKKGIYNLQFKVHDHKHMQHDIEANVTVNVKEIPLYAVTSPGSLRISGISHEDFVRQWNYSTQSAQKSKAELFQLKISEILNVDSKNVDIFGVKIYEEYPPMINIYFTARENHYYKSERLNGILLMHREDIEKDLGINITMIGINECLLEKVACKRSCTNILEVNNLHYLVDANKTSLVGININNTVQCMCETQNFDKKKRCSDYKCFNGGQCIQKGDDVSCLCPTSVKGRRCQQTTISFQGNGWAWFSPLNSCDTNHLSLEFLTNKDNGILLYNGPITAPKQNELILSDFIFLELYNGKPRLLLDLGSGTLELIVPSKSNLTDGEWHRIDVFWTTENVRLVVDFCKSADVIEGEEGVKHEFNDSSCQIQGKVLPFNEYLNIHTPLQLGGIYSMPFLPSLYHWQAAPSAKGFHGCIRNLFFNGKVFDLADPGLSKNSAAGCPQVEYLCSKLECGQGTCIASHSGAYCKCDVGWTGPNCFIPTIPSTFMSHSYVKFALSFEPDHFVTQLQLRFRTREQSGELFRITDQHNREYAILEISNSNLCFRFNLNSYRVDEKQICLNYVTVNDGIWHTTKISRYGSAAIIEIDDGEAHKYNESFEFKGHQWLTVDKQEGVYAGGKAEYTGLKTFEVYSDYQKGCMDDIRLEGKSLPLPPATNGTQWGQATVARNMERNCPSNQSCTYIICPEPFKCVDIWNQYECACEDGWVLASDHKSCIPRNDCFKRPCLHGGTCISPSPHHHYHCLCSKGYWGQSCEMMQQKQILKLSFGALAAILICLTIIIVLVFIIIAYNYKRAKNIKTPPTKDDIRENVISYDDEGGGEDDMTAFDITPLQIPIQNSETTALELHVLPPKTSRSIEDENVTRLSDASNSCFCDDLRSYGYEGSGSVAQSLSSLTSDFDEKDQDFNWLSDWGTRFSRLYSMYNVKEKETDDE